MADLCSGITISSGDRPILWRVTAPAQMKIDIQLSSYYVLLGHNWLIQFLREYSKALRYTAFKSADLPDTNF